MKKLINLLLLMTSLLIGCQTTTTDNATDKEQKKCCTHNVFVLVDNTEKSGDRSDLLSKDGILKLFVTSDGNQAHGKIVWREINNISINRQQEIEYTQPADGTTILLLKRHKEKFLEELDDVYSTFLGPSSEKNSSSIYAPICGAFQELNKSEADKNIIIILSDMTEFSDCANFYKCGTIDVEIEAMVKKVEKCGYYSLPDNPKNLEVIILFQPLNTKQDQDFHKSMVIWKRIFEKKGIPFSVKANL